MVHITDIIYDPTVGHDVRHNFKLSFEPNAHKTKKDAATALAKALRKWAVDCYGYTKENAEAEIHCWKPDRTQQYSGIAAWCVIWEGGPFEWAIGLSHQLQGPWGYTEPYYSFDLHFTE